jgi:hypothetical protein
MLFSSSHALAQGDDAAALPEPRTPPPAADAGREPPQATLPAAPRSVALAPLPTVAARMGLDDPERYWYGWQLLISDFVALGTLGVAAAAGVKGNSAIAVIVPVAIVYDLGSPTIHWLHGRKGIAAASFGVRAGVPFVGVLAGMAVGSCGGADTQAGRACRSQAAGYGALAGFALATAIDATFFAFDAPASEKPRGVGLRWVPLAVPAEGGATLGVVGTF